MTGWSVCSWISIQFNLSQVDDLCARSWPDLYKQMHLRAHTAIVKCFQRHLLEIASLRMVRIGMELQNFRAVVSSKSTSGVVESLRIHLANIMVFVCGDCTPFEQMILVYIKRVFAYHSCTLLNIWRGNCTKCYLNVESQTLCPRWPKIYICAAT